VCASEPDLPQPTLRDVPFFDEFLLFGFIPRNRMERSAFVVETQSVPGVLHIEQQGIVAEFHRPDPLVDGSRELVDRQAVGDNGVPDAEEMDFDGVALEPGSFLLDLRVGSSSRYGVPDGNEQVSDLAPD
jgi:hypothetical protein